MIISYCCSCYYCCYCVRNSNYCAHIDAVICIDVSVYVIGPLSSHTVVVKSPKQGRAISPEPLTDKDLGAITQAVRDWRELGLHLQISEEKLSEIDRTHRSNSERCSSMLSLWHSQADSSREILARNLQELRYNRLSEFLMTKVDSDVFFFK